MEGVKMPQCKWCGKKGILLKLDEYGLCKNCHAIVLLNISQIARIINDSIEIINKSKKLDTKLSRLELIEEKYKELLVYENAGINPSDKLPSKALEEIAGLRDDIIIEHFEEKLKELRPRIESELSATRKINLLTKLHSDFLKHKDLISLGSNKAKAARFEKLLKLLISKYEYEKLVEKAKKSEFKGQKKSALNAYYDALYYLKNNQIEDELEIDKINFVKNKISELGGTLPSETLDG